MKKLKYILFLLILLLTPKAFCATYNVSSKVEAIPDFGGGTYGGYAKGIALPTYYNVNTRYNGQLAILEFYLDSDDWDWNYNKTYTITLNMATDDWRNNFMGPQVYSAQSNGTTSGSNLYVSNTFRFISYKQIKFNFKIGSSLGPYLKFRLYSSNTNTTNITGVSNWRLSSISISDVSPTPTVAPVNPTPTPTGGMGNQDIINNNNSNTENIIDNNAQNTTDIINNNNSNTQEIINSQNEIQNSLSECTGNKSNLLTGTTWTNNYVRPNGTLGSAPSNTLSDFILISGIEHLTITTNTNFYNIAYALYNGSKTILATYDNYQTDNLVINVPSNATYIRVWFNYDNSSNTLNTIDDYDVKLFTYYCTSKIDDTTNAINDVNNSINNPNVDNGVGNNFFDNFENNMHGLSSIITIPLSAIQSLSSSQCSPLHFPIPFTDNKYLDVPCMTEIYQQHVPTLLTLIQTCWYGILAYQVLVNIFGIVKGFKDPDSDKIEVMDL